MGRKGREYAPADDEYEPAAGGDDDDGLDQLLQFSSKSRAAPDEDEDEEEEAKPGKKKGKKKEADDDAKGKKKGKSISASGSRREEEVDDSVKSEEEAVQFTGKKKKKKEKKADPENAPEAHVEEPVSKAQQKKKAGKNKFEPDPEDEVDESVKSEEEAMQFTGKKKKKKEKKGEGENAPEAQIEEPVSKPQKKKASKLAAEPELEVDEPAEPSPKKKGGNFYDQVLNEEEEEEDDEVLQFTGKKKKKKGKKPALDADEGEEIENKHKAKSKSEAEELINNIESSSTGKKSQENNAVAEGDEEVEALQFTGKKKKKSKGKKPAFEEPESNEVMPEPGPEPEPEPKPEPEPAPKQNERKKKKKVASNDAELDDILSMIESSGKPQKNGVSKAGDVPVKTEVPVDDQAGDEEGDEALLFTGKKKKKGKGKKPTVEAEANEEPEPEPETEPEQAPEPEPEPEPVPKQNEHKNKKKAVSKKEADAELDDILSMIESSAKPEKKGGKKAPSPAPAPAPVKAEDDDQLGGDEERVETAAEKKKRKKKEKEKAAKASAAAAATAEPGEAAEPKEEKASGKKAPAAKLPPKHVREKLEQLAKLKEAEERRKREEEERIRKEEEERLRQEQLERDREDIKRRKKEREKEKLRQKKAEGKVLTGKQKEEQRRLALQRGQILGGAQSQLGGAQATPKKPKYESKKPKKTAAETPATQPEVHEEPEPEPEPEVEPEPEPEQEPEPESEEDEEDWDAKSWDSDDLQLIKNQKSNSFDEEDVEEEPPKPEVVLSRAPSKKEPEAPTPAPPAPTPSSEPEKKPETTLRSPICCILGHVDTGKTKLLDCIRRTNVQEGEAGGITQQIGATYFPKENIQERTKALKEDADLRVPGLLVIDTPGHESFTNLRSRGSSLCDIAILVVDIMHGLEPQTIESLNLLRMRKTPLVVALNKVDRLYDWKSTLNAPIRHSMKNQPEHTLAEFEFKLLQAMTQLKEQGVNSEVYWKNKQMRTHTSTALSPEELWELNMNIVPTSAVTGEGVPDLLLLLVKLTEKRMESELEFKEDLQCTVLEVKVVEGLGTTIDVVLVNGVLHEGDQIVVCGMQGPIFTTIRALLTPHPMKELRVKGSYLHHKELRAAQGIKITAQGLEHAVAGSQLYVVGPDDDVEEIKREAMQDMDSVLSRIDKSGEGVCVQASTLGSLEALLEFLKSVKIPVSGIGIGPVHRKDVMKATVMLEKKKEFATILAFDVKVNTEARELADESGVRIFTADIIYHLFDQFSAYMESIRNEKRSSTQTEAVFPCIMKIIPGCVFNQKDPLILGVEVLEGTARLGTPICVPRKNEISLGKIASLENNHKVVELAKTGEQVAVKIVGTTPEESQRQFGRHFDLEDELVSHVTRRSIDVLKENFRDDVSKDEWKLLVKLKAIFKIQ